VNTEPLIDLFDVRVYGMPTEAQRFRDLLFLLTGLQGEQYVVLAHRQGQSRRRSTQGRGYQRLHHR
jgi:hypothetical protein